MTEMVATARVREAFSWEEKGEAQVGDREVKGFNEKCTGKQISPCQFGHCFWNPTLSVNFYYDF